MGRRGKFIRDVKRGREKPRDKGLWHYPDNFWEKSFLNLYKKLKTLP